jgi:hypothetical protein
MAGRAAALQMSRAAVTLNLPGGLGGPVQLAPGTNMPPPIVQNPTTGPVSPTNVTFTPGTGAGVAAQRPRTGTVVPAAPAVSVISGNSGPGGVAAFPNSSTIGITGTPQIVRQGNPVGIFGLAGMGTSNAAGVGNGPFGQLQPTFPVSPNATTESTGIVGVTGTAQSQAPALIRQVTGGTAGTTRATSTTTTSTTVFTTAGTNGSAVTDTSITTTTGGTNGANGTTAEITTTAGTPTAFIPIDSGGGYGGMGGGGYGGGGSGGGGNTFAPTIINGNVETAPRTSGGTVEQGDSVAVPDDSSPGLGGDDGSAQISPSDALRLHPTEARVRSAALLAACLDACRRLRAMCG